MSSVSGLKVRPSTATVLPRREPPAAVEPLRAIALAVVVDAKRGFDNAKLHVMVRAGALRDAGAADAGTGMKELGAAAVVEPDAARDVLDVGTVDLVATPRFAP
jgi:hypothetical protein